MAALPRVVLESEAAPRRVVLESEAALLRVGFLLDSRGDERTAVGLWPAPTFSHRHLRPMEMSAEEGEQLLSAVLSHHPCNHYSYGR